MQLRNQARNSFKKASKVGISPRLILAITFYTMISLLIAVALLYSPIVVVLGLVLAALIFDIKRWIHRSKGHSEGVL